MGCGCRTNPIHERRFGVTQVGEDAVTPCTLQGPSVGGSTTSGQDILAGESQGRVRGWRPRFSLKGDFKSVATVALTIIQFMSMIIHAFIYLFMYSCLFCVYLCILYYFAMCDREKGWTKGWHFEAAMSETCRFEKLGRCFSRTPIECNFPSACCQLACPDWYLVSSDCHGTEAMVENHMTWG